MRGRGFVIFLSFVFLALGWFAIAVRAEDAKAKPAIQVSHTPKQPKTGDPVRITVKLSHTLKAGDLVLQYQAVDPGKYIALADPAYAKNWTTVRPSAAAQEKAEADDSALTFELPAELQRNRRLVRYRVYSPETKAVVAPVSEDPQRNFAYFVYDGVPEWRGAIHPNGSAQERKVVTFDANTMRSVQAYHLISKQPSIENVTWYEPKSYMDPTASEYKYTGTLVANGKVYDHIRFRARGGSWRHAMGKNMWKIDFLKGHHLEAVDNWGEKYDKKWGKLNLGACIQQAAYGMRGEHGMLEAVSFRLFNLGGVEAPHTHWVQLRIVDTAEESPADQYRGDFWGLYLAVENVDDHFLEEHDLPDGNLYKMDVQGPESEHLAPGSPADGSDVRQFMSALRRNREPAWWQTNVDLSRYYSYRSTLECIHHYDIGMGKNYYYFHNLKSKRWQVVPWDVDLTWGDHMYGDGAEPFYQAGILGLEPCKSDYLARLTEIRDLLFNPEQTGALIDEYAAVICPPGGGPSLAEADRVKWDYHPIMSSRYTSRGRSDPGMFYQNSPTRDFKGMTQLMKQYVERRGQWVDRTLLAGGSFPATPAIERSGALDISTPTLNVKLSSPKPAKMVQWRLAEVTPAKALATQPGPRGRYEINALWEAAGGATAEVPTKGLEKGHTYRIRARVQNDQGKWSHWSAPEQFTPQ
jgi:hypothetical protein